jgi:hypothetical protein
MSTCKVCGLHECATPTFCKTAAESEAARKKGKRSGNGKAGEQQPPAPNIEELETAAGDLINCPNILARFGTEVESAGLVGETGNAKILYLALTTRLFERPTSIAIKGVSAGGKSFTVEQVLKFFPPAAYFVRTGMSERAIIYSTEDYRYRFIIIFEAAGMNSDLMSYLIRTLLSEGRVVYEVVEKTKMGLRPRRIEKEGPTGLITTTTAPKLHPENETRLLSLGVIDTPDQTRAVMQALAADDAAKMNPVNYALWHTLQTWLATGERRVAIPFAAALAGRVPPVAVRLRRDFQLLLTLIRAHALLHRQTRDRDNQGRVVATVADYAAVRDLVAKLFSEGIEATVPATVRETVEAVRACVGGSVGVGVGDPNGGSNTSEVSLTTLAKTMRLDKNSVHHRVRRAIERGFLVNREEKRGMPAKIALADPLPDELEILPDPALLERWSEDGGVKEEDPDDTESDGAPLPPNPYSNTPIPPGRALSDIDAVYEELAAYEEPAARGEPVPTDAAADYPDFPDFLKGTPSGNGLLPRCDHCGTTGKLHPWDWPGRPDGVTLHSSCEGPFYDSEWRQ